MSRTKTQQARLNELQRGAFCSTYRSSTGHDFLSEWLTRMGPMHGRNSVTLAFMAATSHEQRMHAPRADIFLACCMKQAHLVPPISSRQTPANPADAIC